MQNFDILTLVFLGLAIFVIYKLRSVLGQRTGTEKPPQDLMIRREQAAEQPAPGASNTNVVPLPSVRGPQPAAEPEARLAGVVPPDSPAFGGLVQIMQSDSTFDPREFLGGARAAGDVDRDHDIDPLPHMVERHGVGDTAIDIGVAVVLGPQDHPRNGNRGGNGLAQRA